MISRDTSEDKRVLVQLQKEFLEEIDTLAQIECRSRSELIREALRRYLADAKRGGAIV